MKCKTTVELTNLHGPIPVGTVLEYPKAYRLVRSGHAEPADEECEKAAGRLVRNTTDEVKLALADLDEDEDS